MNKDKGTTKKITQAPPPIESIHGRTYIDRKPKEIDRQLWPKAEHWSLEEAAHLLCAINPGFYRLPIKDPESSLEQRINRTYELLKRSYQAGGLKLIRPGYLHFVPSDIIKWAKKKGLEVPPELRNTHFDFSEDENIDGLVSGLKVSFENDSEVLIQVPGKKAKSVTWEDLGFQSNSSGPWKTFLDIIQEPNHTFELGQSKTQDYSKKHKQLIRISKMLIKFLNKEYSLNIPQDFNMFERDKAQNTGVYKPKFQIITKHDIRDILESKYNNLPSDELRSEIIRLREAYRKKEDENIETKLTIAYIVAKERGILTDEEIEKIIDPNCDKKLIASLFNDQRYHGPSELDTKF